MSTYNTDENVTVTFNFPYPGPTLQAFMADLLVKVAKKMLCENSPMPEEFEDMLTMTVITRPSGSRYVRVECL